MTPLTITLCTEDCSPRTQYIYCTYLAFFTYQGVKYVFFGGEGKQTVNTTHLAVTAGFQTSQLALHSIYRVSDKYGFSYNYFVTGKDLAIHSYFSTHIHTYIYLYCVTVCCSLTCLLNAISCKQHAAVLSHLFCIYFPIVTLFTPQESVETLTTTFVSTCSKQQIPDNLLLF